MKKIIGTLFMMMVMSSFAKGEIVLKNEAASNLQVVVNYGHDKGDLAENKSEFLLERSSQKTVPLVVNKDMIIRFPN